MLVTEYPKKGKTLYFLNPSRLTCPTYTYTIEKYVNLDYFNNRIDAGLCYSTLKSIEKRIEYELSMIEKRKADQILLEEQMKLCTKPIFEPIKVKLSKDELLDNLTRILYPHVMDIVGGKKDRYSHRLITTAILLSKNYAFDSIEDTLLDYDRLKNVYLYLEELKQYSSYADLQTEYFKVLLYSSWHEDSKNITDNLKETDQVRPLLKNLLNLYDFMEYPEHDIFTEESSINIEKYKEMDL